jgi:hypothetical protein
MGVTLYCICDIACDGDPCRAPYAHKRGPHFEVSATDVTKAKVRRVAQRMASDAAMREVDGRMLCWWCQDPRTRGPRPV